MLGGENVTFHGDIPCAHRSPETSGSEFRETSDSMNVSMRGLPEVPAPRYPR